MITAKVEYRKDGTRLRRRGTATRNSTLELHAGSYYPTSDRTFADIHVPFTTPHGYSEITDCTHHGVWQPCTHWRCNYIPGTPGRLVSSSRYYWLDMSAHVFTTDSVSVLAEAALQASRGPDFEDWFGKLYMEFTDQFPNEFSLVNNLIELREGISQNLPVLSDLKESLSNNFLKLQFGIKPFIGDLTKLCGIWKKFHQRMMTLKMQKVIRCRKRYHAEKQVFGSGLIYLNGQQFNAVETNTSYPYPVPVYFQTVFKEDVTIIDHYVTALISNQLFGLERIDRQVDALAGMVGLTNPLKIIWEWAHFSWLIDWFWDVSSFLDRMEGQPFQGNLVIKQCYTTTKVRTFGKIHTLALGSSLESAVGQVPGEVLITGYVRAAESALVDNDSLIPSLQIPSLSGSRTAVLLALLDQRSHAIPNLNAFLRNLLKKKKH